MNVLKTPEDNYVCDDIIIRNIHNYHLREYIDQFIKHMIDNYEDSDISNFLYNIETLKIKEKSFNLTSIFGRGYDGCYDSCTNTILIYENEALFHELFHMASTYFDKKNKRIYQGFLQVQLKKNDQNEEIGVSLNEGYTEHLCSKYFKIYDNSGYAYEKFIMSKIEGIVGPTKMEKLYFNADLYNLINELKQYATESEIMNFIHDFDMILNHENSNRKKYQDIRKNIYYFLYKIKLIKIRKDLDENKITPNMAILMINNFVSSFIDLKYSINEEQSLDKTYLDVSKTYSKVK